MLNNILAFTFTRIYFIFCKTFFPFTFNNCEFLRIANFLNIFWRYFLKNIWATFCMSMFGIHCRCNKLNHFFSYHPLCFDMAFLIAFFLMQLFQFWLIQYEMLLLSLTNYVYLESISNVLSFNNAIWWIP